MKVLRGLLLKKPPKQGLGQSPKVFPVLFPKFPHIMMQNKARG